MFRGTWSAVSGEVEGNNEGRARRDQDCSADGGRSAGPQREHGKGSRDEVFRLTRMPEAYDQITRDWFPRVRADHRAAVREPACGSIGRWPTGVKRRVSICATQIQC
jgi:hypothetical protein